MSFDERRFNSWTVQEFVQKRNVWWRELREDCLIAAISITTGTLLAFLVLMR